MLDFIKKLFQPTLPNAAIAWQQAGNNAGNTYWLYAAPVHLVLQRDSFSLAEPVPQPLKQHEIDALTADLNAHFASDNKQFFWHEDSWFLRLQHNPQIDTTHPQLAINKNITPFMPTGEGAMAWASFQNEVQMLLFAHPINAARELKKMTMINSIWCYGGGQVHAN
ncbi:MULTISPECIES: hypothetical protein [Methylotenera]|uniref:hypothetical protein n=1 Tax=Methylotenera TaxID=359407 RepID=UPI0003740C48|nr:MULTISPECIES: hypothetical protein [Methylotenera]